jgi:Na+-translocating ferredoxin:NAD+ oxidoreductase RNF subunit RnfB
MNTVYITGGVLLLLWLMGGIIRRRRHRHKTIQVVDDRCTGCCRCLKRCRRRVLDKVSEEKGAHVFVKNAGYCTACGDCLSACKFKALEMAAKK